MAFDPHKVKGDEDFSTAQCRGTVSAFLISFGCRSRCAERNRNISATD
jgi:hypothetical protein